MTYDDTAPVIDRIESPPSSSAGSTSQLQYDRSIANEWHDDGQCAELYRSQFHHQLMFDWLLSAWREETRFSSSLSEIVNHQAYQTIISLGPRMIPLIIEDLNKSFDHWSYALHKLTGYTLTKEERANSETIRQAWLEWYDRDGRHESVSDQINKQALLQWDRIQSRVSQT